MQRKPSSPPMAPKGLTPELCAVIADHTRRHPCLAVLLRPLWDCLRRLTAAFDRLFAELHALAHAPIAIAAPIMAPAADAPTKVPLHATTRSIRARRPRRATIPAAPAQHRPIPCPHPAWRNPPEPIHPAPHARPAPGSPPLRFLPPCRPRPGTP